MFSHLLLSRELPFKTMYYTDYYHGKNNETHKMLIELVASNNTEHSLFCYPVGERVTIGRILADVNENSVSSECCLSDIVLLHSVTV